jgi:hypothetical protein
MLIRHIVLGKTQQSLKHRKPPPLGVYGPELLLTVSNQVLKSFRNGDEILLNIP